MDNFRINYVNYLNYLNFVNVIIPHFTKVLLLSAKAAPGSLFQVFFGINVTLQMIFNEVGQQVLQGF
jgi:hypothetical protein